MEEERVEDRWTPEAQCGGLDSAPLHVHQSDGAGLRRTADAQAELRHGNRCQAPSRSSTQARARLSLSTPHLGFSSGNDVHLQVLAKASWDVLCFLRTVWEPEPHQLCLANVTWRCSWPQEGDACEHSAAMAHIQPRTRPRSKQAGQHLAWRFGCRCHPSACVNRIALSLKPGDGDSSVTSCSHLILCVAHGVSHDYRWPRLSSVRSTPEPNHTCGQVILPEHGQWSAGTRPRPRL